MTVEYPSSGSSTDELESTVENARQLAEKLGLDGYPVTYWLVDYDEMNELIAYDGFPKRYPHWRWGMKYERQRKKDRFGGGKAFEIVINDDPAHAYLQESNSLADQKAVITHVEAHADFFKNNRWYRLFADEVNAVDMLERHAERIESFMADSDVDREDVERFIDDVLSIADTIDQHQPFEPVNLEESQDDDSSEESSPVENLDVSEEIKDEVFDEEWLEARKPDDSPAEGGIDVLAFLRKHGKQYDEETERAVEMEQWQKETLDMLRREAFYFAPQKMTKVMNEGFAAYFESIMMGEEAFAGTDEFLRYAEHQSRVLGSPGFNPYSLGKQLWEYVENLANRREVVEHLLRVEGITPKNFHDEIDFEAVLELLEPPVPLDVIGPETVAELADLDQSKVDQGALDRALSGDIDVERFPWKVLTFEGLAERHYSLIKPQHRGFLARISREDLVSIDRYLLDGDRYPGIEAAIEEVDRTVGWERIFEVRESHNDVTFIDEFLTGEFVREESYFTYEYSHATDGFRVASTDPEDVKKKLLLQFANFGKPTITVQTGNYENRNELLLAHQYNGIQLDIEQAAETLKRVFELWGRPVNLETVVHEIEDRQKEMATRRGEEPPREERGMRLRYDGEAVEMETVAWEEIEDIVATDVTYDTRPDEWS